MLAVLSTLNPSHYFSQKSYKPVKNKQPKKMNNNDGFFDDLPPSFFKGKKVKRSRITSKLVINDKESEY